MAKQKPSKPTNNPPKSAQSIKKQTVNQAKTGQQTPSFFDGWLPIVAVLAVTFLLGFRVIEWVKM